MSLFVSRNLKKYITIWTHDERRLLLVVSPRRFSISFQQGNGKTSHALQDIDENRDGKVQRRHHDTLRKPHQLIPEPSLVVGSLLWKLISFHRAHDKELWLSVKGLVILKKQITDILLASRRCC